MANTKISDFTSGAPAQATDEFVVARSGSNFKLTGSDLKTLINTPGGTDTQVQFNDGGVLGGDAGLTFNKTTGRLTLGSSGQAAFSTDLFLTRRAAANLRLGAADAAAPAAQTLSVQSVVAGTTNTAGANLTITGSQGTGNAAGGSIIFQVAPAGSSGTAQNALATALTIGSDRALTASAAISASGAITTATYLQTSGGLGILFASNSIITAPSSGVLRLVNWAETDFGRLQFGGTTNAFPALKRVSANLQVIAADNAGSAGLIVGNQALATNATDGFLYVPTCAGTPTGTPTTQTGTVPIVVDTTNNKLYFYSGAQWRDAGP